MKLDRHDKDCYRIMEGTAIVGFAMRMSNGKWGAYTTDDIRLTRLTFSKPAEVRDWFAGRDTPTQEGKSP